MEEAGTAVSADVQALKARIAELEAERARFSQTEQELRQSEERYRALLEYSPIAIFIHDGSTILYANRETARLLGYAQPEQLVGTNFWEMIPETSREFVQGRVNAVFGGEGPSTPAEVAFLRRDGTPVIVEVFGALCIYQGRKAAQVVARDMSKQKHAEELLRRVHEELELRVEERAAALRENQSRLDLALRAAEIGLWSWDLLTDEVYFSPHFKRQLGYEDNELSDRVDEWWGRMHPEDLPRVKDSVAAYLARPWPNYEIDFRLCHRDGSYRWMLTRAEAYIEQTGKPNRMTGCLIDITDRKKAEERLRESEERFREVTETITEVFWLEDWSLLKVLYVSPAYERIWGRPAEELYNNQRNWVESIHPDEQKAAEEAFLTKAALGEFDVEYRIIRPDGGQRWIRDRGFPICDEAGKVVRIAGIAQDITLLKEAQEEAALAQHLASIGTFASGIAHEINNPITAILLSAYAAQRRLGEPAFVAESLAEIVSNALRCARIVKGVRRFSQKKEIEKLPSNLSSLVNVTADLTREFAQSRGVSIHLALGESSRAVDLNPSEIEQVLVNLIRNAVQACKAGDHVWIETSYEPDHVLLKVRDDGCGMSPDARRFALDPFYTTKQKEGGTGLGLSLVRGIVTDHGGTIEIESEEGKGTTVMIKLPC
jgi:PAS domain S-box-containing protein